MVQSQDPMTGSLKIGQLSAQTGVSVDTVRFYERRGLLPEAERSSSGYRLFSADDVARIRLIKRLQGLGMSLAAIGEAMREPYGIACDDGRRELQSVLARIDGEMTRLAALRSEIEAVLGRCSRGACEL